MKQFQIVVTECQRIQTVMEDYFKDDSVFSPRFYVLTNTVMKGQEIFGPTSSWKD